MSSEVFFCEKSDYGTVYVNMRYIDRMNYDEKRNKTVVCIHGEPVAIEFTGSPDTIERVTLF